MEITLQQAANSIGLGAIEEDNGDIYATIECIICSAQIVVGIIELKDQPKTFEELYNSIVFALEVQAKNWVLHPDGYDWICPNCAAVKSKTVPGLRYNLVRDNIKYDPTGGYFYLACSLCTGYIESLMHTEKRVGIEDIFEHMYQRAVKKGWCETGDEQLLCGHCIDEEKEAEAEVENVNYKAVAEYLAETVDENIDCPFCQFDLTENSDSEFLCGCNFVDKGHGRECNFQTENMSDAIPCWMRWAKYAVRKGL